MADTINGYGATGYAVSSTLQDILARRVAQSRQAMLDQLAAERAKADIYESKTRADAYKAEQEAEAQQRTQDANNKWRAGLAIGDTATDDEIASHDAQRYFKKQTPTKTMLHVPTEEEAQREGYGADDSGQYLPVTSPVPTGPEANIFQGDTAQRDAAERNKLAEYYMNHPDELQNMEPLGQALVLRKILPQGSIPETLFKKAEEKHSPDWYAYQDYAASEKAAGRKPLDMDAYLTHDANRKARASAGTQSYNNSIVYAPDPDNPGKTLAFWADPRTKQLSKMEFPVTKTPPKPDTGEQNDTVFAKAKPQVDKYIKLKGSKSQRDIVERNAAVDNLIGLAQTTPKVRQAWRAIRDAERGPDAQLYSGLSSAQLAEIYGNKNGFTPQEKEHLLQGLSIFRGE
jgi:hypothetical protein